MEFSWTTFILEVINFVVLVWILKRFLYQPILNIVEQRRTLVEQTTEDAKILRSEADELQQTYQKRLSDWEREREVAREKLHQEIEVERKRLAQALAVNVEQEREKSKVLAEREAAQLRHHSEEQALRQAGNFTSRLLARIASPEVETKLIEMVLADLDGINEADAVSLRHAWQTGEEPVFISSGYPIEETQKIILQDKLNELLGGQAQANYSQDQHLIAGVRISVGPWVIRASLQDELAFFTKVTDGLTHDE